MMNGWLILIIHLIHKKTIGQVLTPLSANAELDCEMEIDYNDCCGMHCYVMLSVKLCVMRG